MAVAGAPRRGRPSQLNVRVAPQRSRTFDVTPYNCFHHASRSRPAPISLIHTSRAQILTTSHNAHDRYRIGLTLAPATDSIGPCFKTGGVWSCLARCTANTHRVGHHHKAFHTRGTPTPAQVQAGRTCSGARNTIGAPSHQGQQCGQSLARSPEEARPAGFCHPGLQAFSRHPAFDEHHEGSSTLRIPRAISI